MALELGKLTAQVELDPDSVDRLKAAVAEIALISENAAATVRDLTLALKALSAAADSIEP